MAEITRPNENKIITGNGVYKDIQANLIDVLQRTFFTEEGLNGLGNMDFMDVNPQMIVISEVPAIFVWTDGGASSSKSIGGLGSKKLNRMQDYYCTVQMIHSSVDESEARDEILLAGSVIEDAMYQNMNLNDLMNHAGEVLELNFFPQPFKVGGSYKMMQGFELKLKFSRTNRQKQSTR